MFVRLSTVALVACLAACSSSPKSSGGSTSGPGSPSGGSNGSSGATNEGPQAATEKGVIVEFGSKHPVAGATVIAADQTVTTGADGSYSFTLQKGQPFKFTVVADGYAKLIEQEATLDADFDKGQTTIVPTTTANLLTGMLKGYDASLGVLSVQLVPTGGCASEGGSTLSVAPEGSAQIAYFERNLPSSTATSVNAGQFPSAVIYNVQPNVDLQVSVHGSCSEAAFPFAQGAVKYTGTITTEAGETTGFARVFLQ